MGTGIGHHWINFDILWYLILDETGDDPQDFVYIVVPAQI